MYLYFINQWLFEAVFMLLYLRITFSLCVPMYIVIFNCCFSSKACASTDHIFLSPKTPGADFTKGLRLSQVFG